MPITRRLAFVAALLVAGCNGVGAGSTAATLPASPVATVEATTPSAVAPTNTPAPTGAPPPLAVLMTADAAHAGNLGSYVIDGRGSDTPAYPFGSMDPIAVPAEAVLHMAFAGGEVIGDVSLTLDPPDDTTETQAQGVAGVELDAGGTSLTLGPLPVGRWVLAARLFRADGRGDGVTYWAVIVR